MVKKSKVFIIALVVAVVFGCVLAAGCTTTNNTTDSSSSTPSLQYEKGASDVFTSQPENVLPNVKLPGFKYMTLPANTTVIDGSMGEGITSALINPKENEGYYNLTFKITLDNGETIYTSGLVEPGKHIQSLTLTHGLTPGTYNAVLTMQPYLIDDQSVKVSVGEVPFTLYVI